MTIERYMLRVSICDKALEYEANLNIYVTMHFLVMSHCSHHFLVMSLYIYNNI